MALHSDAPKKNAARQGLHRLENRVKADGYIRDMRNSLVTVQLK